MKAWCQVVLLMLCIIQHLSAIPDDHGRKLNSWRHRLAKNRINPNLLKTEQRQKLNPGYDMLNRETIRKRPKKPKKIAVPIVTPSPTDTDVQTTASVASIVNRDDISILNIAEMTSLTPISTEISQEQDKTGYGIIYTGNIDLLPLIYVSISILNYMGYTSYPIQIFVNGRNYENDMAECNKKLVIPFIARFPSISCEYIDDGEEHIWQRFSYKILALLRTKFQNVLFLDDDNIIIQDPTILFQSKEYLTNGAIFWPDFWGKNCDGLFENAYILYGSCLKDNGVYNILDKTYVEYDENNMKYTQSQEAAQLVIDTVKHFDTLELVLKCTESDEYQRFLHGDKDCFRFMWLNTNSSFYFTPIMPQYTGFISVDDKNESYFHRHALFQFWDNKEKPIFIHQTKWIEPMDHTLWQYYQEMTNEWSCAVINGQDRHFPFPNDDQYTIIETKTGKENGELIDYLEKEWAQHWHEYDSVGEADQSS